MQDDYGTADIDVSNPFRGKRAAQLRMQDDYGTADIDVSNPFRGKRAAQQDHPFVTTDEQTSFKPLSGKEGCATNCHIAYSRNTMSFQTPFGERGLRNIKEVEFLVRNRNVSNPFRGKRAAQLCIVM